MIMGRWDIAINDKIPPNTIYTINRDNYPDVVELPDSCAQFLLLVGTKDDAKYLDERKDKVANYLAALESIRAIGLHMPLPKLQEIAAKGFTHEYLEEIRRFETELLKHFYDNVQHYDKNWSSRQNAPSTRTLQ